MKNGEVKEKYNERLSEWTIKFHGMKIGDPVNVKGWGIGKVVDYNLNCKFEYIDVFVEVRGFNSQYVPHNVTLLKSLGNG